MKRFLSLFFVISLLLVLFIMPMLLIAQTDVTNIGITGVIDNSGKIIIGIKGGGWTWVKYNWYFLLGTIVAIGFIIVRATPNKEDDAFFNKWIVRGFRLIGKIMTIGTAKDYGPPEKK